MISTIMINNYTIGEGTDVTIRQALGFGSPVVQTGSIINSGRHGVVVPNTLWRERRLRIELGLRSATISAYKDLREDVLQAFGLPRTGNSNMEFTTIDGRDLQVTVQLMNEIDAPFEQGRLTSGIMRLELIAPSPYLNDQTLNATEVSLPVPGGTVIPAPIPLSLASSGGSAIITNNGNGIYKPTITITGPVVTPIVKNNTTGKLFTINLTLGASDSIVIDCDAETVVLNGSTNSLSDFEGDFWDIPPGANTILFSAATLELDALASVAWRSSWLGI